MSVSLALSGPYCNGLKHKHESQNVSGFVGGSLAQSLIYMHDHMNFKLQMAQFMALFTHGIAFYSTTSETLSRHANFGKENI